MKISGSLLLAFCTLAAFNPTRATTVIPPTFDQLVNRAEVIFEGTVENVTSQWTGEGAQRHIVSLVTFTVNESIKGEAGATYTLQMLGGTVGDETMEVTDSPKFASGDRDILFVENNGRQFVPLVGIMYGRFHVQRDESSNRDVVTNDHTGPVYDLAKLGTEDVTPPSRPSQRSLSAADFKAAIRAKLASVAK